MFRNTLAALSLTLIVGAAAEAQERTFITSAPSADEYVQYLFASPEEARAPIRIRGIQLGPKASASPSGPASMPAKPSSEARIVAAPVNFALNSDVIPAEFEDYLDNLAEALTRPEAEGKAVLVTGHTDSLGDDAYNMDLSMRRADAVRKFLLKRGVHSSQIISMGKGETELIPGSNHINRRVEFSVTG